MKEKPRVFIVEVTENPEGRYDYEIREPGGVRGGTGSNSDAHGVGESLARLVGGLGLGETRDAAFARMVSDLDRCEHGRHEGDVCGSCGGPSVGNLLLGDPIGFTMGGKPYRMPPWRERFDPAAWLPEGRA